MQESAGESNLKQIQDYYQLLENTAKYALSKDNCEESFSFSLAGKAINIKTSGIFLKTILQPAFSHILINGQGKVDLQITVWDENFTGVTLPPPPWQWPDSSDTNSISNLQLKHFIAVLSENRTIFFIYNMQKNAVIVAIKDSKKLPNYFLSSPFVRIINSWIKTQDLLLLHAGCVGFNDRSVLIVGKGGSGKSTTALTSLLNGLYYLSDDYLLVNPDDPITAYSMFNSGKLHTHHLQNFNDLIELAVPQENDQFDKPLMFLSQKYTDKVISKSPLKAIVAPIVTSQQHTKLLAISPFNALKSLAPSTIIQLNNSGNDFAQMAMLTKKLPCFQLQLGADYQTTIAPILTDLLNKN
jgi:hypothetical protein